MDICASKPSFQFWTPSFWQRNASENHMIPLGNNLMKCPLDKIKHVYPFQLQSLSKPRSSSPIGVDISISRARAPGKRGDQCFKEERAAAPLGLRPPTIAQYCPVLPSIAQYSLALPRLAHQLLHCSEASNKSSLRLPSVMQIGGGGAGLQFLASMFLCVIYIPL